VWWEPTNESEKGLRQLLDRLVSRYFLELQDQVVYGVGSVSLAGRRTPLLLVDLRLIFESVQDIPVWISASPENPHGRIALSNLARPFADAPAAARQRLRGWELPGETVLVGITPPEAVSAGVLTFGTGDMIMAAEPPNERGTIGFPIRLLGSQTGRGFLTAGHLVTGNHEAIKLIHHSFLRSLIGLPAATSVIGRVQDFEDPATAAPRPCYDVAVVACERGLFRRSVRPSGVANLPMMLEPTAVRMYGAVSGNVSGYLDGALTVLGSGARHWLHSWMLLPSGVGTWGDSGSLVVLADSKAAVGLVVGGSKWTNRTSFGAMYVQDARSLVANWLAPRGVSLDTE
jgi:hypothetical protein